MNEDILRQIVNNFERYADLAGKANYEKQPLDKIFKTLYANEDKTIIISIQNVPVYWKTGFEDVSISDYTIGNEDMKTIFEICLDYKIINADPDNDKDFNLVLNMLNSLK